MSNSIHVTILSLSVYVWVKKSLHCQTGNLITLTLRSSFYNLCKFLSSLSRICLDICFFTNSFFPLHTNYFFLKCPIENCSSYINLMSWTMRATHTSEDSHSDSLLTTGQSLSSKSNLYLCMNHCAPIILFCTSAQIYCSSFDLVVFPKSHAKPHTVSYTIKESNVLSYVIDYICYK